MGGPGDISEQEVWPRLAVPKRRKANPVSSNLLKNVEIGCHHGQRRKLHLCPSQTRLATETMASSYVLNSALHSCFPAPARTMDSYTHLLQGSPDQDARRNPLMKAGCYSKKARGRDFSCSKQKTLAATDSFAPLTGPRKKTQTPLTTSPTNPEDSKCLLITRTDVVHCSFCCLKGAPHPGYRQSTVAPSSVLKG